MSWSHMILYTEQVKDTDMLELECVANCFNLC